MSSFPWRKNPQVIELVLQHIEDNKGLTGSLADHQQIIVKAQETFGTQLCSNISATSLQAKLSNVVRLHRINATHTVKNLFAQGPRILKLKEIGCNIKLREASIATSPGRSTKKRNSTEIEDAESAQPKRQKIDAPEASTQNLISSSGDEEDDDDDYNPQPDPQRNRQTKISLKRKMLNGDEEADDGDDAVAEKSSTKRQKCHRSSQKLSDSGIRTRTTQKKSNRRPAAQRRRQNASVSHQNSSSGGDTSDNQPFPMGVVHDTDPQIKRTVRDSDEDQEQSSELSEIDEEEMEILKHANHGNDASESEEEESEGEREEDENINGDEDDDMVNQVQDNTHVPRVHAYNPCVINSRTAQTPASHQSSSQDVPVNKTAPQAVALQYPQSSIAPPLSEWFTHLGRLERGMPEGQDLDSQSDFIQSRIPLVPKPCNPSTVKQDMDDIRDLIYQTAQVVSFSDDINEGQPFHLDYARYDAAMMKVMLKIFGESDPFGSIKARINQAQQKARLTMRAFIQSYIAASVTMYALEPLPQGKFDMDSPEYDLFEQLLRLIKNDVMRNECNISNGHADYFQDYARNYALSNHIRKYVAPQIEEKATQLAETLRHQLDALLPIAEDPVWDGMGVTITCQSGITSSMIPSTDADGQAIVPVENTGPIRDRLFRNLKLIFKRALTARTEWEVAGEAKYTFRFPPFGSLIDQRVDDTSTYGRRMPRGSQVFVTAMPGVWVRHRARRNQPWEDATCLTRSIVFWADLGA